MEVSIGNRKENVSKKQIIYMLKLSTLLQMGLSILIFQNFTQLSIAYSCIILVIFLIIQVCNYKILELRLDKLYILINSIGIIISVLYMLILTEKISYLIPLMLIVVLEYYLTSREITRARNKNLNRIVILLMTLPLVLQLNEYLDNKEMLEYLFVYGLIYFINLYMFQIIKHYEKKRIFQCG